MAASPRVLFLAPVEPWCRENGSSVIIADLLHGLSRTGGAEIFPVFLRNPPAGYATDSAPGLEGVQLGLHSVPKWVSIARALATRSTPIRMRFDNVAVARAIESLVRAKKFAPDVVHVEHLPLVDIGLALARTFGTRLVYRAHNVEAQLLERRMAVLGSLVRTLLPFLARSEAEAIAACDLTLCISEDDLAWVRGRVPNASAVFFPCSLLLDRYDVSAFPRSRTPRIGFAGGLDWTPNVNGLRWFVDEVLPLILRERPDAHLAVLARNAEAHTWMTGNPAIQLLDAASDARALFASSWVTIAPLLQGGGVRIKIPESLALGCPVAATAIGAEGHAHPAIDRADDPVSLAAACVRRLRSAPDASQVAAMRRSVEERHGATGLARRLTGYWTELAEARR